MCTIALVIELLVVVFFGHYIFMAGQEFRYITRESLHSYSNLALALAGACAAGLWALLPIAFERWAYGEAPLAIRLSATALILGAVGLAAFMLAHYRMYEVGRNGETEKAVRLSNCQLAILFFTAFVGLTGVTQGAVFLVAALWGWKGLP